MKVSGVYRMIVFFLLGGVCFTFLTFSIMVKHINNGNEINIGKIKIKNSEAVELPITLTPEVENEEEKKWWQIFKRKNKDAGTS
jgi:Na+/H+ antiporter NhaC